MGAEVKKFEIQFAKFFGSKYAVMVNSGSSANLLAIAGLVYHPKKLLKPGDEVIVPAVSWGTTYYPVTQMGLKLRFVDIDAKTFNIDPDLVEKAITRKTRAIFAVNLLGNPCDMRRLKDICKRHKLLLIEDNCESMGAMFGKKMTGTFGICGTFSTFFSHHISTMEGALGQEQLKKLPKILAYRRKNAKIFASRITKIKNIRIQKETENSSWFGFAFVLEGPLARRRTELIKLLTKAGIECRPIVAGNFLKNPVIKYLPHTKGSKIKAAEEIDKSGFFLGNHHYDIKRQMQKALEIFAGFSGK